MKRKNKILIMIILMLAGMVALKLTQSEEIPDDWRLILVNDKHSVPKNYEPELTQLSNGIYIDSRIYPDLQQMFDDARRDGIYPVVSEGYRTREQQKKVVY